MSKAKSQSVHATNLPSTKRESATVDGPMNWIIEPVAKELRSLGVNLGSLAKAKANADAKSTQLKAQRHTVAGNEGSEKFVRAGGRWEVMADKLNEEEHTASLFYAWMDHYAKGVKLFGEVSVELPKRLRCLPHVFPAAIKAPAPAEESTPAVA